MSFYLMHRGWLDHDVFGDPEREPLCKRAAWAWLIDRAEYAAKQVRIGREIVTLRRGQLSYSLRYLARAWGWNQERVRRFLCDLAARDMVVTANATASVTAQTVVTICNYERYQAPSHKPRDSLRDAARRQNVTNYKEKEGNQDKEGFSKNLREDLGRCAPAREGAHEAEAPEEDTRASVVEAPPPIETAAPPPPEDEPPLTAEERAERVRQLDEVIAALNRRGAPEGFVHDPDAYQRSVEARKWANWLNGLHGFASERFEADVRMRAWEAIDCARTAGSRDQTPRQVRDVLNQISTLRGAEQRVAA